MLRSMCLSQAYLFINFNRFNSSTTDADFNGDAKKSGLTGRLQNLKASIGSVRELLMFLKLTIRTACPILFLKNIKTRHAIK